MARIPPFFLFIIASFLVGVLTLPLRREIQPPEQDLSELDGLGQAVIIGSLGGLRALAADFLWLQTNYYWQQENHGLTKTTARTVTRLQPDFPYFWIEASRMIIYDMPVWRFGKDRTAPKSVEQRIRREQAERGLELLREGEKFAPESAALPAEQARVYWTVLDDPEMAQEYYRIAYEKPSHRALYARLRAVILMDLGRDQEALMWLRRVLAGMDPSDNPAQYSLMQSYVQELQYGRNPRMETDPVVPQRPLPLLEIDADDGEGASS